MSPCSIPRRGSTALKRRVADYPEALRRAVVRDYLFMAEFTLAAFAPKFAARSDTYGTAACLTRAVNELVLALFALNRKYPLNDKTALAEVAEFERAPREFGPRVRRRSRTWRLPGGTRCRRRGRRATGPGDGRTGGWALPAALHAAEVIGCRAKNGK